MSLISAAKVSPTQIAYAAQLYLPPIRGLEWFPICLEWAEKIRHPDWPRENGFPAHGAEREFLDDAIGQAIYVAWKAIVFGREPNTDSVLGGIVKYHHWQSQLLELRKQRTEHLKAERTASA